MHHAVLLPSRRPTLPLARDAGGWESNLLGLAIATHGVEPLAGYSSLSSPMLRQQIPRLTYLAPCRRIRAEYLFARRISDGGTSSASKIMLTIAIHKASPAFQCGAFRPRPSACLPSSQPNQARPSAALVKLEGIFSRPRCRWPSCCLRCVSRRVWHFVGHRIHEVLELLFQRCQHDADSGDAEAL